MRKLTTEKLAFVLLNLICLAYLGLGFWLALGR